MMSLTFVVLVVVMIVDIVCSGFFFQAEDGIRDLVRSRGLGDVYKRQIMCHLSIITQQHLRVACRLLALTQLPTAFFQVIPLSLIHI